MSTYTDTDRAADLEAAEWMDYQVELYAEGATEDPEAEHCRRAAAALRERAAGPTPAMHPLRARLHAALSAKGWTVSDVARRMPEVARSTVGHWFNGRRTPTLKHLEQLARALDVSAASLLEDEPGRGRA